MHRRGGVVIFAPKPYSKGRPALSIVDLYLSKRARTVEFSPAIVTSIDCEWYLQTANSANTQLVASMEGQGRSAETYSDPVPDMVKQFVVYLYRHIR